MFKSLDYLVWVLDKNNLVRPWTCFWEENCLQSYNSAYLKIKLKGTLYVKMGNKGILTKCLYVTSLAIKIGCIGKFTFEKQLRHLRVLAQLGIDQKNILQDEN